MSHSHTSSLSAAGNSLKHEPDDYVDEDEDDEMDYSPQVGNAGGAGGGGVDPGHIYDAQLHQTSKVDLTNLNRGIWLVKVPKYLASRWERISGDVDAGKLQISKEPGSSKPKVTLTLSDATLCLKEADEQEIPREHELCIQPMTAQCLGVFSAEEEEIHIPPSADDPVDAKPDVMFHEKVAMEGVIHQRLDCRPVADKSYLKLKMDEIRKMTLPVRQVIQLDRPVNTYKPVADHRHNKEYEEKRKAEGKKSRDDKDRVLEMLFSAFEKHQYYNLKDLVTMTNQPVGYLKEVLKEVCNYCMKNPHKNMWELKPEYRHYKSDTPAGDADEDDDDNDDDMDN